jgi:hypothetical protein
MIYYGFKEKAMSQASIMTQEEEAAIIIKAVELKKQGKLEECERMMKQLPLPPYLAKFAKDHFEEGFLTKYGWNLSAAEAEFGPGWLTK